MNPDFIEALEPSWSPDGTRTAFTAKNTAGDQSIRVVDADGTGLTKVADEGNTLEWAPNDALILFSLNGKPHAVPATGGTPSVLPHWGEWIVTPRHVIGIDWQ